MDEKKLSTLLNDACFLIQRQEYSKAINTATKLIFLAKNDQYYIKWGYAIRSWGYYLKNNYTKALKDSNIAINEVGHIYFKDGGVPIRGIRIYCLYHLGKYEEALKIQNELIKEVPEVGNYKQRAKILIKLKRYSEARADLKRAAKGIETFHPQYRRCYEEDLNSLLKEIEDGEKQQNAKK